MLNKAIRKYAAMAYLTIVTIASLAIPHFAYGEAEKPVKPSVITYKGPTWDLYVDGEKISFLQGFYQGAFYGAINYKSGPDTDEYKVFLDTVNTYGYPDDSDLKIISAAVDNFYADDDNLVIPIHEALAFIAKEKENKNMVERERMEWLKKAREKWGNK